MEEKKISFVFTKQLKKSNIISEKVQNVHDNINNIELVECLEANSIKVIGGNEKQEKTPLIIPLAPKKLDSNNDGSKSENKEEKDNSNKLSLDDLAARELIAESQNISTLDKKQTFLIPKLMENEKITGEKESTLEDYEQIPVTEFGLAMLRGMGWKEEEEIGKTNKLVNLKLPNVRPKGMGLGADKMIKEECSKIDNKNDEVCKIVKGAFVRVISGRLKNKFGQIQGFDDDSGSIIVKMALSDNIECLQEFLVQPVSQKDYNENSKVINLEKYENYKQKDKKIKSNSSDDNDEMNDKNNKSNKIRQMEAQQNRSSSSNDKKYSGYISSDDSDKNQNHSKYYDRKKDQDTSRHKNRKDEKNNSLSRDRKNERNSNHNYKSNDKDYSLERDKDNEQYYKYKSRTDRDYSRRKEKRHDEHYSSKKESNRYASRKKYESDDESSDDYSSRKHKKSSYKKHSR